VENPTWCCLERAMAADWGLRRDDASLTGVSTAGGCLELDRSLLAEWGRGGLEGEARRR